MSQLAPLEAHEKHILENRDQRIRHDVYSERKTK